MPVAIDTYGGVLCDVNFIFVSVSNHSHVYIFSYQPTTILPLKMSSSILAKYETHHRESIVSYIRLHMNYG